MATTFAGILPTRTHAKIAKLGIPHYPFKKALDVEANNFDHVFPERARKKSQLAKLNFDLVNAFILRAPEYYADLKDIYREFPFDLFIADCTFTGIPFVREKMKIPTIAIGVLPLIETSKDLAPSGLGIAPSSTAVGRVKQAILRWLADEVLFRSPNRLMRTILDKFKIRHNNENVFDLVVKKSTLFLQSGTPGFEYKRSDLSDNIRFIGALLPHQRREIQKNRSWVTEKLLQYEKVVLVTQGTVEKDVSKIIVPTLEAFRGSNYLVVATTGGSCTEELKRLYPDSNFIIEDFIPFDQIMPYTHVYVTNGGYGGVMLGIQNQLPLVVAGVHEGKNEINARVGYFNLGINLKTERPTSRQIRQAIDAVLKNTVYKQTTAELAEEFQRFDPYQLTALHVAQLMKRKPMSAVNESKVA